MCVIDGISAPREVLLRGCPRLFRDLRGVRTAGPYRAAQLTREHPDLTVDCDPIFIKDGQVWTSAGVTAGMDLALVDADLGRGTAAGVD